MQINTNLSALFVQGSQRRSGLDVDASVRRLSSGLRINTASDDGAGMAIAERLGAGVNGMGRAARNVSDGISLLQVAEGAVGQIVDNFQRLRELAVQAANGSNNSLDRQSIQREADALVAANFQIANESSFNQMNLLDGSYSSQLQVGAYAGDTVALAIPAVFTQHNSSRVPATGALRQVNATGQAVAGALGAGDLSISNTAIGASAAGGAAGQGADSAYAIAAAINAAQPPDVTASASTSVSGTAAAGAAIPNGGLSVNGVALGPIGGASAGALAASAAAAITAAAGASGVSASASGDVLTLTAADGRDIVVSGLLPGYAASLGLNGGATHGSVTLSDLPSIVNHSLDIGGANPALAGFAAGPLVATLTGATGTGLVTAGGGGEAAIDLSSFAGATAALGYIDSKIASAGDIRSLLGATENRLAAAHANLDNGAAVLAGARARIRDADYASETAQLTRSQIVQQAATAMLAQANAQPRQALQLLR